MSTQLSGTEVLRFEIAINGAAYQSLVANLRDDGVEPYAIRPLTRPVKASLELDLASGSYSVSTLGKHRLPTTMAVKPGSRTHRNITGLLATSLRDQEAADLMALIQDIIDATPHLTGESLAVYREDLEFQPPTNPSSTSKIVHSVEILGTIAPTILLDIDETPTLVIPEEAGERLDSAVELLRLEAQLASPLRASVVGNTVDISCAVTLPPLPGTTVDLYLHWGSYDVVAPAWQDELIGSSECTSATTITLAHQISISQQGHYGATLFARPRGTQDAVWLGALRADDARFTISHDDVEITRERDRMLHEMREIALSMLTLSVQYPHTLPEQIKTIRSYAPHLGLGALLKEAVDSLGGDEYLHYLHEILTAEPSSEEITSLLSTYGVGEVVFTTPEGPHAAAGGLAQVISGLPRELQKAGIPVTVITPLYAYENGNKHSSAQHLLSQGIQIGPEKVIPTYLGSVTVNLGPTYHTGTTYHRRAPSAVPVKVFLAQAGSLRVFLLSNRSVFDRLYQPVYADEQLRRAIIFSRATLETIITSHFGIRPSAIISNDWMTACVPAFATLDPRYQEVQWLKDAKTIHMIHNGGADYHGRLPTHANHEDLWPLFNLAPEHFFGFRDPHNYEMLNLTMAASQHVSGAVLTVSQPYAHQITQPGGGDGIDYVLRHKRDKVFGISNAVSRAEIDRYLSSISGVSESEFNFTEALLKAKAATRESLQHRFGLNARKDAQLVSFVGRLAEQKGLSLLSGWVGGGRSALEELLIRHEKMQLLVAGPTTEGDRASIELRNTLNYLAWKYPGRVATHFDYIPHAKALEIIFGSTFFLMPSRFEPGGITQLEALAAGTLVIGRNIGGISATIENYNQGTRIGNGFLFNDFTTAAFVNTAQWALTSSEDPAVYTMLVANARSARHTWSDRVQAYLAMLQKVALGQEEFDSNPWNTMHRASLSTIAVTQPPR
jgi:starch synthase